LRKEDKKQNELQPQSSEAQRKAERRRVAAAMKDRQTPEEREALLIKEAEGEQAFFQRAFPELAVPLGQVYDPPEMLEGGQLREFRRHHQSPNFYAVVESFTRYPGSALLEWQVSRFR
jgi:hypothetical protein